MKVQYIPNTCDIDNWECGEQTVAIYDGEPIFVHDFSDNSCFDITDSRQAQKEIQERLKTQEEIFFERFPANKVRKKLAQKIKDFIGC